MGLMKSQHKDLMRALLAGAYDKNGAAPAIAGGSGEHPAAMRAAAVAAAADAAAAGARSRLVEPRPPPPRPGAGRRVATPTTPRRQRRADAAAPTLDEAIRHYLEELRRDGGGRRPLARHPRRAERPVNHVKEPRKRMGVFKQQKPGPGDDRPARARREPGRRRRAISRPPPGRETYDKLKLFSEVLSLVESSYVDEVDSGKLVQGAIRGMLKELDPHTAYMTEDMFNEMQVDTKGEFGGLGITIGLKNDVLTVISPIEDTPAWRAGIKAGDRSSRSTARAPRT